MDGRKNEKRTRGRPFGAGHPGKPFQAGNPGRPKGARNKATLAAEAMLDGEGETLTRKAIELAKAGDLQALKLCLDRILPPRKDRPVTFDLPPITSVAEAAATISSIMRAVAAGEITPGEASEVGKLIDSYVKAAEATDLAERISRLERIAANDPAT